MSTQKPIVIHNVLYPKLPNYAFKALNSGGQKN